MCAVLLFTGTDFLFNICLCSVGRGRSLSARRVQGTLTRTQIKQDGVASNLFHFLRSVSARVSCVWRHIDPDDLPVSEVREHKLTQ